MINCTSSFIGFYFSYKHYTLMICPDCGRIGPTWADADSYDNLAYIVDLMFKL